MFELTPYERRHQRALFNPFRDMENFEKNFWGDMAATDFKTDIKDNGKEYVLEAELPGFKKEDIHVDIEDGYMTISAERSNETEKKDDKGNFVRRERSYGAVSRSFDISSVKTEDITGEYKDGVLTLTASADGAILSGTLRALGYLQNQGIEKITFTDGTHTATIVLADLIANGEAEAVCVLTLGAANALTLNGGAIDF